MNESIELPSADERTKMQTDLVLTHVLGGASVLGLVSSVYAGERGAAVVFGICAAGAFIKDLQLVRRLSGQAAPECSE